MKKIIGIFMTSVICCAFAGCSAAQMLSSPPQPQITGGFTADCTVTAYIVPPGESTENETEFTFSGQLKRLGSGFWSMEITSPDTLTGLSISAADDIITSTLDELTFDVQTSKLPDASPPTALFSSMDDAAAELESMALSPGEDGGWVYSGNGCTIIFDSDGIPVSLTSDQPKMTVCFSGFVAGASDISSSKDESQTVTEASASETQISETVSSAVTADVTTAVTTTVEMTTAETAAAASGSQTSVTVQT